ncbi:hypothetical protein G9C85_18425 [Halorubellus sp. JP-L1]|uniref:hypothetical protein n=1 Tax=Halorubellus sp. JP-L1 TaxID=2715753 RepID=UPI00140E196E|nr:hypothetical protein [Halorubellus sp. JP-L1]NHN43599.1 hypothetical protein [Halorubellus sp. JP-L1]
MDERSDSCGRGGGFDSESADDRTLDDRTADDDQPRSDRTVNDDLLATLAEVES